MLGLKEKLVKITETFFIPFKTLFLLIFFKLAEKNPDKYFPLVPYICLVASMLGTVCETSPQVKNYLQDYSYSRIRYIMPKRMRTLSFLRSSAVRLYGIY